MKMPSARGIRLALTTLGFAGLIVALNAAPATATLGSGFSTTVLGRGTNQSHGTIPITQGLDVVMLQNTIAVGGYSGWHSHPGGAIVVIAQGQITTHASDGNHCVVTTYTTGETFVEGAGKRLNAVNTGTIPTITVVTFPGVPVGVPGPGAWRTDEPDPGNC
jgi:quercetin dioxygenase-like cupin family protein